MVSLTWIILDQHGERVLGMGNHIRSLINSSNKVQLQEYLCDVCDEITTDEDTISDIFNEVFPIWLENQRRKSDG